MIPSNNTNPHPKRARYQLPETIVIVCRHICIHFSPRRQQCRAASEFALPAPHACGNCIHSTSTRTDTQSKASSAEFCSVFRIIPRLGGWHFTLAGRELEQIIVSRTLHSCVVPLGVIAPGRVRTKPKIIAVITLVINLDHVYTVRGHFFCQSEMLVNQSAKIFHNIPNGIGGVEGPSIS